jgi:hypothetical protein
MPTFRHPQAPEQPFLHEQNIIFITFGGAGD